MHVFSLPNNVLLFRYLFSIKCALNYAFWTHIDHNPMRALEIPNYNIKVIIIDCCAISTPVHDELAHDQHMNKPAHYSFWPMQRASWGPNTKFCAVQNLDFSNTLLFVVTVCWVPSMMCWPAQYLCAGWIKCLAGKFKCWSALVRVLKHQHKMQRKYKTFLHIQYFYRIYPISVTGPHRTEPYRYFAKSPLHLNVTLFTHCDAKK